MWPLASISTNRNSILISDNLAAPEPRCRVRSVYWRVVTLPNQLTFTLDAGAPAGALIGRIGEGQPFYVGNHLTLTTRQDGTLKLGINDYWHSDNTGALQVRVAVASRP